MKPNITSVKLLLENSKDKNFNFDVIANSGSNRRYFRISFENKSLILAENEEVAENESFFYFTDIFRANSISVPKILAISKDKKSYLLQDLDDESMLQKLLKNGFTSDNFELYQDIVKQLIHINYLGKKVDFSNAYDYKVFDERVVLNDLFYFKNYFLDRLEINYKRSDLIDDFLQIAQEIETLPNDFLVYRDFQARNIFIYNDVPYFIDYQGSMQGFLCYDLVSLLWQAKANLPEDWKISLKELYFTQVLSLENAKREDLEKSYNLSLILRFFQLKGAYGYRGLVEKKAHFLESIVAHLENIKYLINNNLLDNYKTLKQVSEEMVSEKSIKKIKSLINE